MIKFDLGLPALRPCHSVAYDLRGSAKFLPFLWQLLLYHTAVKCSMKI